MLKKEDDKRNVKMLKETESEETKLFCPIFIFGGISIGGDPGSLSPYPGYAYVPSTVHLRITRHNIVYYSSVDREWSIVPSTPLWCM